MKRSEINSAITAAKDRLVEYKISLPDFGYWKTEEWLKNRKDIGRIIERMLGWDVTDFGSNDFEHCGAVLFTVRNGDKNDKENKAPYAEKYIFLKDKTEQQIPLHYHIFKTEDIINRGGGVLCVQIYNKSADGGLDESTQVNVWMDGIKHRFEPGETIRIFPGNSITLEPYMYHRFYAEKDKGFLIVGEVSKVNDDNMDNVFLRKADRFIGIEEDEHKLHPLVNEYDFD